MPELRFFAKGELQGEIELSEEESHHIKVMRIAPGDVVEVVNGQGILAEAEVIKSGKKTTINILKILEKRDPPPPIVIAQGMPKPSKLDMILEKGTELGMSELILFDGEKSQYPLPKSLERQEKVLIAAMKQCGTLFLPKITLEKPLSEWKTVTLPAFFGDVRKEAHPFLKALQKGFMNRGILFFVGPESGFSEEETLHLEKLGVVGVCLNRNILRTETASVAALAVMNQQQLFSL